jgi:hypothetical protein
VAAAAATTAAAAAATAGSGPRMATCRRGCIRACDGARASTSPSTVRGHTTATATTASRRWIAKRTPASPNVLVPVENLKAARVVMAED